MQLYNFSNIRKYNKKMSPFYNLNSLIYEESENPLTKFFNKKSNEHAYYLYNEFERMVFIKDKHYLISYDKVYTYELTNYGLVPLSETYLY